MLNQTETSEFYGQLLEQLSVALLTVLPYCVFFTFTHCCCYTVGKGMMMRMILLRTKSEICLSVGPLI